MRGFYSRAEIAQAMDLVLGELLAGQKPQDLAVASATQRYALGARRVDGDRVFRYGKAGAVALAPGKVMQMPVPVAAQSGLAPSVNHAIGDSIISVTVGAGGVTADEYAGGYLVVMTGAGAGQVLPITHNTAATAGNAALFYCGDTLKVAITAAGSTVSITPSPYSGVVIQPSPPTALVVGVPLVAVTAAYWAWLQTWGPASVLQQGAVYLDSDVMASRTVDGAVESAKNVLTTGATVVADSVNGAIITNSMGTENTVRLMDSAAGTSYDVGNKTRSLGRVLRAAADTQYCLVDLRIRQ